MDLKRLLAGRDCPCGRRHDCAIREVIVEEGAVERVAALTAGFQSLVVIADENTYPLCGERIRAQLGTRLERVKILRREGVLVPDERAIAEANAAIREETDLILGIGSGVIQDLCKYVSFERGLPYMIVATAPSMDGYASVGAAMILGGMKVTKNAQVPLAILCDTAILREAPMEMIQAGYGDILGKASCLNDWKLSHLVNGEYYCPYVAGLTAEMLDRVKDLGPRLLAREAEAVGVLTEALIGVGVAMAYVGNSRPASGSEHHMAHYFEIVGLTKNERYFPHGIDVFYSSVWTQRLREGLLVLDRPPRTSSHDERAWEANIRRVYAGTADGVLALQRKLGWYAIDRNAVYRERWEEIRTVLAEAPSSEAMRGYIESVGLDFAAFEAEYGREKIEDALLYAKDLKDRYSVLWMYYDCR